MDLVQKMHNASINMPQRSQLHQPGTDEHQNEAEPAEQQNDNHVRKCEDEKREKIDASVRSIDAATTFTTCASVTSLAHNKMTKN